MIRKESTYISRRSLLQGLLYKLIDSELFVATDDDGYYRSSVCDDMGGDARER